MDINYKIKDRLNEAMRLRGLTGSELAEKSGLNKSSVSRYLNGENVPRSLAIGKMAKALDVSPAWLLGYDLTIDGKEIVRIDTDRLNEVNKAKILAYYQGLLDSQEEDDGNT